MIEEQPDLKALAGQISVEVSPEGVRVEINESEKEPLFESGSARLSPKLQDALAVLAGEYKKLPQKLVIEGHTDSAALRRRQRHVQLGTLHPARHRSAAHHGRERPQPTSNCS